MDPKQRARIRRAARAKDKARARFAEILAEEHAAGATLEEIGNVLDTSKQAVAQLLKRAGKSD